MTERKKGWRLYALAGFSGVLHFFIFPNFLHLELWWLAWIALVPLFFALSQATRPREAALLGLGAGVCGYPLLYHWLIYTFNHYAAMGYLVSALILLLMVLALSGFLAGFGTVHFMLSRRLGWPAWLSAAASWVAFEYLRAYFPFGGFPWAFLAYSQHNFLPLIQISDLGGPYLVSFVLVVTNAGVSQVLENFLRAKSEEPATASGARLLFPLLPAVLLPLLAIVYGLVRMGQVDRAFAGQPRRVVGVVQANIDQGVKWDEDFFWQAIDSHLALTAQLMKDQPELVMWPEAAVTVSNFNEHWAARSSLIERLSAVQTYFLTGAPSREWCGRERSGSLNPEEDRCWFNSVYLFSPGLERLLGRYDKMHLVPFGEYVPLKRLLFFADAIAHGNTGGSTPGTEVRIMELPGLRLGCVICYEVIFPHLVRRFVKEGANFMTTVTNDAWFGKTGAPYQHHSAVVFRAVENRVFFARAANTGVSSIVDPVGRVLHETPIYEPAAFVGTVQASPLHSFYTRTGDLFARLVSLLCVVGVLFAIGQRLFSQRF